ncbi:MAG TPA: Vms1/Ankzf1 family peptidyl-tRNA hydrolase [Egibacteraceae bacterium]|nr:Vms1/Ankzf1 family peptidyl-tRNA hydrolase [Egibacteraceae bacterium]
MDVTAADIRKLVDRPVGRVSVTSVYLNTDGARFPKAADYEARLDALLRDVRKAADKLDVRRREGVHADVEEISRWVRREFERGDTRGLALFACGGEIFETVQIAEGFRNVARVGDRPYVVPLEAMLGRYHHIGLALVQRDKAMILRYQLGRLWTWQGLVSDVHGQHVQGGWSQRRFELGIEHEVLHHFKDTAEVLRLLHEEQPMDALVLAGPHEEVVDFQRQLHPYLQKIVHGEPQNLDAYADRNTILERLRAVEQELVSARRAELLERLAAAQGQAEKAARGLRHVLEAVNGKRVETLFVVEGTGVPGWRSANGALALHEDEAAAFGTPVEPVDDVVDEVIEEAVRSGAHIEFFRDEVRLDGHPVAALLRF